MHPGHAHGLEVHGYIGSVEQRYLLLEERSKPMSNFGGIYQRTSRRYSIDTKETRCVISTLSTVQREASLQYALSVLLLLILPLYSTPEW